MPAFTRERQLERLIDETPFMLTRCSRDCRYLFVSRAYARMLGRDAADIEDRRIDPAELVMTIAALAKRFEADEERSS